GANGWINAKVVSRWPSQLGGSSGTTNVKIPPFFGSPALAGGPPNTAASATAVAGVTISLVQQLGFMGFLPHPKGDVFTSEDLLRVLIYSFGSNVLSFLLSSSASIKLPSRPPSGPVSIP